MKQYRLERTGERWLVFEGELIAQSDGQWAAGKEQNRWHDLRLYRTAGGRYVVHVIYRTKWEGELDYSWAEIATVDEFADVLRSYEPAINVQGFPDRPQYTTRQAALLAWIRRRYGAQVVDLLRDITPLDERVA